MSPWKPKVACKYPGCPELVDKGYCKKHEKMMPWPKESYHHLYNTPRWVKYRRWFLSKHPLCMQCEAGGRIEPAVAVDHIRPYRQGDDFYDMNNHQALCITCHNKKTAEETGFGSGH